MHPTLHRYAISLLTLTLLPLIATQPTRAQGAPPGPPPVIVAKPVVQDIVEYDEYTGRFEASESVEVRARATGYLDSVERVDGAVAKAGDLVRVNDTLLTTIVAVDPIRFCFDVDERSYLAYARSAARAVGAKGESTDVSVATSDEREPKRPGKHDFVDNGLDDDTGTVRARAVLPNTDL